MKDIILVIFVIVIARWILVVNNRLDRLEENVKDIFLGNSLLRQQKKIKESSENKKFNTLLIIIIAVVISLSLVLYLLFKYI